MVRMHLNSLCKSMKHARLPGLISCNIPQFWVTSLMLLSRLRALSFKCNTSVLVLSAF